MNLDQSTQSRPRCRTRPSQPSQPRCRGRHRHRRLPGLPRPSPIQVLTTSSELLVLYHSEPPKVRDLSSVWCTIRIALHVASGQHTVMWLTLLAPLVCTRRLTLRSCSASAQQAPVLMSGVEGSLVFRKSLAGVCRRRDGQLVAKCVHFWFTVHRMCSPLR